MHRVYSTVIEVSGPVVRCRPSTSQHHVERLTLPNHVPVTSNGNLGESVERGGKDSRDVVVNGKTYKDLVWWYKSALPESVAITNTVSCSVVV